MKKILFLLLLSISTLQAQSVDSLFLEANNLYKSEQYKKATELYLNIEKEGLVSSELYYNLGNSYYKLNKVGPSIYYYKKALTLDPKNEDIQNNLIFAQRLALDNIEALPKTVFQKINENFLQTLSYNQWAWVVVMFSILGSLFFLLYYFTVSSGKKRFYFVLSTFSFILLAFSFFITINQYSFQKNNQKAIVFAEETEVRNAPSLNAEEVFKLHEGTSVTVLDKVDDWKKIKLADGKQGWIIAEEIKQLNE